MPDGRLDARVVALATTGAKVRTRQRRMPARASVEGPRSKAAPKDAKPARGTRETEQPDAGDTPGAKCALVRMQEGRLVQTECRHQPSDHALVRVGSAAMPAPFAFSAPFLTNESSRGRARDGCSCDSALCEYRSFLHACPCSLHRPNRTDHRESAPKSRQVGAPNWRAGSYLCMRPSH